MTVITCTSTIFIPFFVELLHLMTTNLAKLKALIRNEPYLKGLVNKDGYTLPFICAWKDYSDAMQMFIDENIDCNEVVKGTTIFHEAASFNSLETLKLLLRHKPDALNLQTKPKDTILHWACSNKNIEIIGFLLGCDGIDVNIKNQFGYTPLHIGCLRNSTKIVAMLLGHQSIDICIKSNEKKLPEELTSDVNIKRMIRMKRSQK